MNNEVEQIKTLIAKMLVDHKNYIATDFSTDSFSRGYDAGKLDAFEDILYELKLLT